MSWLSHLLAACSLSGRPCETLLSFVQLYEASSGDWPCQPAVPGPAAPLVSPPRHCPDRHGSCVSISWRCCCFPTSNIGSQIAHKQYHIHVEHGSVWGQRADISLVQSLERKCVPTTSNLPQPDYRFPSEVCQTHGD